MKSTIIALTAALAALPLTAAADKSFPAPASWTHVVVATPSTTDRAQDVWKNGTASSADTLAVLTDPATKYDDAIAAIKTNVAAGAMKVTVERDLTCDSRKAHLFELVYGLSGKEMVVDRTVVAAGAGSMAITYTRSESEPFDPGVKSAMAAYCGAS